MSDDVLEGLLARYKGTAFPDAKTSPADDEDYPYRAEIEAAGKAYGVDTRMLRAMARQESAFDPNAISEAGAQGLFQLMPGTAQEMGVKDPMDPAQSAMGGARYLRAQLDRFGEPELAWAAYNAGPGAVEKHGGVPPFEETQNYVKNVRQYFDEYDGKSPTGTATPPPGRSPTMQYLIEKYRTPQKDFTQITPGDPSEVARLLRERPGAVSPVEIDAVEKGEDASAEGIPTGEKNEASPAAIPGRSVPNTLDYEALKPTPDFGPSTADRVVSAANSFMKGIAEIPLGMTDFVAESQYQIKRLMGDKEEIDQFTAYKVARILEKLADRAFPEDKILREEFLASMFPSALGQGVGFMLGGFGSSGLAARLGKYGKFFRPWMFAGGAGAAISGAEGARIARQAEAEQDQILYSWLLHSGLGITEAAPIAHLFNRLDKGTGNIFKRALVNAIIEGGEEAIQEAVQQTGSNKVVNWLKIHERELFEDVPMATGTGAAAGFTLGLFSTLVHGAVGGGRGSYQRWRQNRAMREIDRQQQKPGEPPTGKEPEGEAPPPGDEPGPPGEPTGARRALPPKPAPYGYLPSRAGHVPDPGVESAKSRIRNGWYRQFLDPDQINEAIDEDDLGFMVRLATLRRQAWKEYNLRNNATPEETALLNNPDAPKQLIYQLIGERIAVEAIERNEEPPGWTLPPDVQAYHPDSEYERIAQRAAPPESIPESEDIVDEDADAPPDDYVPEVPDETPVTPAPVAPGVGPSEADYGSAVDKLKDYFGGATPGGAGPPITPTGPATTPAPTPTTEPPTPTPAPPTTTPTPETPAAAPTEEPTRPKEHHYAPKHTPFKASGKPVPEPNQITPIEPMLEALNARMKGEKLEGAISLIPIDNMLPHLSDQGKADYLKTIRNWAEGVPDVSIHGTDMAADLQMELVQKAHTMGWNGLSNEERAKLPFLMDMYGVKRKLTLDTKAAPFTKTQFKNVLAKLKKIGLSYKPGFLAMIVEGYIDGEVSDLDPIERRALSHYMAAKGLPTHGKAFKDILPSVLDELKLAVAKGAAGARTPTKVTKPTPQFMGDADPDLGTPQKIKAKDLVAGQVFAGPDGQMYRVESVDKKEVIISWLVGKEKVMATVEGRAIIPYTMLLEGEAAENAVPGALHTPTGKGPRVGPKARRAPKKRRGKGPKRGMEVREAEARAAEEDPFKKAPQEIRVMLVQTGMFWYYRGVRDEKGLGDKLVEAIGTEAVRPMVPGLIEKLDSLPAFSGEQQRKKKDGLPDTQPATGEPEGAPGGEGVPTPVGPGGGPVPSGTTEGPAPTPSPPTGAPKAPGAPTTRRAPDEPYFSDKDKNRLIRPGGVATPLYPLYPKVTNKDLKEAFPEEILDEYEQKFGFRPLTHQTEGAYRINRAHNVKGHSIVLGDTTGTGKTATTAMYLDRYVYSKNPKAKVIYVVMNHDLRNQAHRDAMKPLGLRMNTYTGKNARWSKDPLTVNYITYAKLQRLEALGQLHTIQNYSPDYIIFDESQTLRNWFAGTSTALAAEKITMINDKVRTLFMSATPYESVLHTGYLTSLGLWGSTGKDLKGDWATWISRNLGIQWDDALTNWTGLSPKKLKAFHETLIRTGRITKTEMDYGNVTDRDGKKLTLTAHLSMVRLKEDDKRQYERVEDIFKELYLDPDLANTPTRKRLIGSLKYIVFRALDESHKVDTAIAIGRKAQEEGKMPIFSTFRKGDTDFDKWWAEYLDPKHPRKYTEGSIMPELIQIMKESGIKIESPVQRIMGAFPDAAIITGDVISGSQMRKNEIARIIDNTAPAAVFTMAAGGTGLSVEDKKGDKPRVQINLSLPDTSLVMLQVGGRSFRMGSNSDGEIYWLYTDTPTQRKKARIIAAKYRSLLALTTGMDETPQADEMDRFDFPEVGPDEIDESFAEGLEAKPTESADLDELIDTGGLPTVAGQRREEEPVEASDTPAEAAESSHEQRKIAPARFKAFQPAEKYFARKTGKWITTPELEYWDLTEDIPGHKKGSTLTRTTLEKEGFIVPAPPSEKKLETEKAYGLLPGIHEDPDPGTEKIDLENTASLIRRIMRTLGGRWRGGKRWFKGGKNTLAYYDAGWDVARGQLHGDLQAFSHEFGHYIDKLVWGRKHGVPFGAEVDDVVKQFERELLAVTRPTIKGGDIAEGIAEFVQAYVMDIERAQRFAPEFLKYFEKLIHPTSAKPDMLAYMKDHKKARADYLRWLKDNDMRLIRDALLTMREHWAKWKRADAVSRVKSTIQSESAPGSRLRERVNLQDVVTQVFDRIYPVRKAYRMIREMGKVKGEAKGSRDVSKLGSLMSGRYGKGAHWIMHHTFKWHSGGGEVAGKSLMDRYSPVADEWLDYETYAKSKRGRNLYEQRGWDPFETVGMTIKEMNAVINEFEDETTPELGERAERFKQVFKDMHNYGDELLNYLVDAGMMTLRTKKAIRQANIDYSPLYRLLDQDDQYGAQPASEGPWGNLWSPVRAIKGSDLPTIPSIEALAKLTLMIHDRTEKNDVNRQLANWALQTAKFMRKEGSEDLIGRGHPLQPGEKRVVPEGLGGIMEMVKEPKQATALTVGEAISLINQKLIGPQKIRPKSIGLTTQQLQEILTVFRPSKTPPPKPHLWVWRGGRREYWRVDRAIYDVMMRIDSTEASQIVSLLNSSSPFLRGMGNLMTAPVRMLRLGAVTLSTRLWIRSMIRDVPMALLHTQGSMWQMARTLPGALMDALLKREGFKKFYAGGGSFSGFIGMTPDQMTHFVKVEMEKAKWKNWWKNPKMFIREVINGYVHLGQSLELMPRIAEAKINGLMEAKTRDEMVKAVYSGREITQDFQRLGQLVYGWNKVVAFYGPAMGGWEKSTRMLFKEAPLKTWTRLMVLLVFPTLIYYLVQRKDDRWKKWSQRDRDRFWVFFLPGMKNPIRLPKVYEYGAVATLIERTMEAYDKKDPKAMDEFAETMFKDSPFFPVNMTPTAILPIVEAWKNWDVFFQRPVYPDRGDPEYQYWSSTSETAKAAGSLFGMSPAILEHLVTGWTGGVGRGAFKMSDIIAEKVMRIPTPTKPGFQPSDIPIAGMFFGRTGTLTSESTERFYDLYNDTKDARETYRQLLQTNPAQAVKYRTANYNRIRFNSYLDQISRRLTALRRRYYKILDSTTMQPEQKKHEMERISNAIEQSSRMAVDHVQRQQDRKYPAITPPGQRRAAQ